MMSASDSDREGRLGEVFAAYQKLIAQGRPAEEARNEVLEGQRDLEAEFDEFVRDDLAVRAQVRLSSSASGAAATGPTFLAGARFAQYRLMERLGRGGMGVVYKAQQLNPDRFVALKMIRLDAADGDDTKKRDLFRAEMKARFRGEIEAVASLQHPNIVRIYESGEENGQLFFSMELIKGDSLAHKLEEDPEEFHKDLRAAARLLVSIAGAVHHAHVRGFIHRDLKPANIIMDSEGEPHVADFGLAKRLEGPAGLTLPGEAWGTREYMAPEQLSGHSSQLTTAVDTYALGIMAYQLLTGKLPFEGSTEEIEAKIKNVDPVHPRALKQSIDPDLETICLKCLAKEPDRRYPSTLALAEDLTRWLERMPILARAPSWAYRLKKFVVRRKSSVAMGLAGIVTLACVCWLGLAKIQERDQAIRSAEGLANQGNVLTTSGAFDQAVTAFKESLLLHNRPDTLFALGRARACSAYVQTLDPRVESQTDSLRLARQEAQAAANELVEAALHFGPGDQRRILANVLSKALVAYIDRDKVAMRAALDQFELAGSAGEYFSYKLWLEGLSSDAEEKRKKFEQASQAWPENALALLGLAFYYHADRGDPDNALPFYEQVSSVAPHLSAAYINRSEIYRIRGNLDAALSEANVVINVLNDHSAYAFNNRGVVFWARAEIAGDLQKKNALLERAKADFMKATILRPRGANMYSNLGGVLRQLGNKEEAKKNFDRSVELDPSSALNLLNRGIARCHWWELDGAIEDLKAALRLNPTLILAKEQLVWAYYNRGRGRWESKQWDGAADDWKRVLNHDPKYAKAHYDLACYYSNQSSQTNEIAERGRLVDKAFEHLKNALEYAGTDRNAPGIHPEADHDLKPLHHDLRWRTLKK